MQRAAVGPAAGRGRGRSRSSSRTVARDVLPFRSRVHHPAFFAFIPGSGTWPGALGDLVASAATSTPARGWSRPGRAQLELEVLALVQGMDRLPAREPGGMLVSGGSAANMTALACARETIARARWRRISSPTSRPGALVARARRARARLRAGAGARAARSTTSIGSRPRALAGAMEADVAAGLRPLFVSVSGGVDEHRRRSTRFAELAAICARARRRGSTSTPRTAASPSLDRARTRAARAASSLPTRSRSTRTSGSTSRTSAAACSSATARAAATPRSRSRPTTCATPRAAAGEVNFADRGLQLTRTSRALKVWMSIRYFGLDAFRAAIDRSLDLAGARVHARSRTSPTLELRGAPSLGVVCFRRRFDDRTRTERERRPRRRARAKRHRARLLDARCAAATRSACVRSTTRRPAEDVERVLGFLERAEPRVSAAARARPRGLPELAPRAACRSRRAGSGAAVQLPRRRCSSRASPRRHESARRRAGETDRRAVDDVARLLRRRRGSCRRAHRRRGPSTRSGAGDFFGEIAALEWAAGYAYPRLATVVASNRCALLVFPDGALNELVREFPALDAVIRTARARASAAPLT